MNDKKIKSVSIGHNGKVEISVKFRDSNGLSLSASAGSCPEHWVKKCPGSEILTDRYGCLRRTSGTFTNLLLWV